MMSILLSSGIIYAQSVTSAQRPTNAKQTGTQISSNNKSLTGSSISCNTLSYVPGATMTIDFTLTVASTDYEYVDGVSLTFPANMVPQTVGTSDPLATANGCGPTMALTPSGQTFIWGQITTPTGCGALVNGTYNFSVSVAIGAGVTGTQTIGYYIMGDGYGAAPHTMTGNVTINQAAANDVGVQAITTQSYYGPGLSIAPSATVMNYGSTPQTFDVSIAINDGTTDVYTDNTTVNNLAGAASQPLTFANWTTVLGNYTVTVTTTLAGDANSSNDVLTKPLGVADVSFAFTANSTDLTYEQVNLLDGSYTGVGALSTTSPFPMAEEYNGINVYRVWNDLTFGTVDTLTGTYTALGTLSGVAGTPTGLAWDWTTSTMYAMVLDGSNLPQLCTVDLGSFVLTPVGTVGTGMVIGIDFANDGFIYGPSLDNDNFYKWDPATGVQTLVGPTGIDLNFGQDVSYDVQNDLFYTITCGTIRQLGTYNLATGAFTMIADALGDQHATFVITKTPGVANDDDVLVQSITAIPSGCGLSGTQTIEITVQNIGLNSQSNIPVYYTINGGSQVTGTVAGPLASGATAVYSFATTADFSVAGAYTIQACTDLAGDMNTANDCKSTVVTNFDVETVPYAMGFETTDDYTNWKIVNTNADAAVWRYDDIAGLAHTGDWFAIYEYSATANADDWLITTCIELEASETYDLSFWYHAGAWGGAVLPEKMKVSIGDAPTAAAMTTTIVDLSDIQDTLYVENVSSFTVPADGVYYIGFYAYSDMDMFYIALDDILIDIHQGINDNTVANVNVYPNPAQEIVNVVSDREMTSVSVVNTLGQVVYTADVNGKNYKLNVANFNNGIYFIRIITENGTINKQILISK